MAAFIDGPSAPSEVPICFFSKKPSALTRILKHIDSSSKVAEKPVGDVLAGPSMVNGHDSTVRRYENMRSQFDEV